MIRRKSGRSAGGAVVALGLALGLAGSSWLLAVSAAWGADSLPVSATSDSGQFEYLYIEANEGGSSGGHVAVRFGPNVYHFQNRDRLLVLDRESTNEFLFSYALLSNRTIHISRIAVDPEVETRLANRFRRRWQAQEAQLAMRDALRRDRKLLEEAAAPLVSVRGLGYFDAPGSAESGATSRSPALRRLYERVVARFGRTHLTSRRRAIQDRLEVLGGADPSAWPIEVPKTAYDHPLFVTPWSTRIENLAGGLAALEVLEQARGLDVSARHAPGDSDFLLDAPMRAALARYMERLEVELVDLAGSMREDWGPVFLIGMARLAAFEASLESGHFVFLDSFPDESATIAATRLRKRSDVTERMLDETRVQLRAALRHFVRAEAPGELAWERVEERLGRHHELMRAARGESDLRLAPGHLVPVRAALRPLTPLRGEASGRDSIAVALTRVRERERSVEAGIEALHGYELLSHNCVTATLDTLNDEFDLEPGGVQRALGGIVEGERSLAFIPFISASQVNAHYRVIERATVPSYRALRLEQMRAEEPGFWLALRESNTLTAEAYRRGEGDSFFVFFTEDPVWLRPVLGAVNLVAALGESIWGLITLPVDHGRTLVSGMKGAFVSLPELAFANIRKGSNDWIPREHRELEPRVEGR